MPQLDKTQMEADFLSAKEDKLGIYQLKHEDSIRDIQFEGLDWLKSHGKEVAKENYELIYVMNLPADMDLERIYEIFNMEHPDDFRGHSLSVSDMVVLHQDGGNSCHFVDRFGFSEIPDFLTREAEKNQIIEQDNLSQGEHSIMDADSDVVAKFKARTEELFHSIEEMHPEEIEGLVYAHVQEIIDTYDMDAQVVGVAISGSRARGLEEVGSDLDVVVEISGSEREDVLFDAFNEDPIVLGGIKVDINPITAEKTGTLESYLPQVEDYLQEQVRKMQQEVTLYVAGCSEFHNFAPVYEGFTDVQEAIDKYNEIYPIYVSDIPAIGVKIHNLGDDPEMDIEWDVLSGGRMDLDMLGYIGEITTNERAMALVTELSLAYPEVEIWGECKEFTEAVEKLKDKNVMELATEIDQFAEDMFPYDYQDNVEDKQSNIQSIADDLKAGNVEYMEKFLKAAVADYVAEGLQDIVTSDTTDIGTVQAVANIRRAEELVQKLDDYKPLAKVEEIEEQNYNMIDNRLNNGFGEKQRKEEEKKIEHVEEKHERVSIKLKLAEKKAEIAKRCEAAPPEKKQHREK